MGIVQSTSIWASDARFLNDSSELSYATTLIDEVVAEVYSNIGEDTFGGHLRFRRGVANAFEHFHSPRPFVACFCEEQDLLSQWRGYGAGTAPVSLGFELRNISEYDTLPLQTLLRKVTYDEEQQRETVLRAVGAWLASVQGILDDGVQVEKLFPGPAIWALQEALAEHYLCFKHPSFQEEREWRLIKLVHVRDEFRLLDDQRRNKLLEVARSRMVDMGWERQDFPQTNHSPTNAEGTEIRFRPVSYTHLTLPTKRIV